MRLPIRPIHCSMTLTRHNISRIPGTLERAAAAGIELVGLQFICPSTVKGHTSMPSHAQWEAAFAELTDLKLEDRLPCQVTFNPPNESELYWELYLPLARLGRLDDLRSAWGIDLEDYTATGVVGCQAGKRTCAIAANGDVFSCEMYMNWPQMRVANVFETPFAEIWSTRFVPMKDYLKQDLQGPCGSCSQDYCGGGCRASAFYFTGSMIGSDMRCPIASGDMEPPVRS